MIRIRLVALVFILLAAGTLDHRDVGAQSPSTPTGARKAAQPIRVLTVGNSFTHNATEYLAALTEAAGYTLTHKMLSIGGSPLERHAGKAMAYEKNPKDEKSKYSGGESLQQALASEHWDFVTIQQVSIKSHDRETYQPFASQLADIVHRYAPQATLLVHQTWAYRKDDPRFTGPVKGEGEPATQEEMYRGLSDAYKTITAELGARRIPVGDAFWVADNDSRYGYTVPEAFDPSVLVDPSLPNQTHSLHVGYRWQQRQGQRSLRMDGHHASSAGKYLAACVWFECLFDESPVGNAFVPNGLDADYAKFLQTTAHHAVQNGDDVVRGKSGRNSPPAFNDPQPQRYTLQVRASAIDSRAKEYPEIGFVFGTEQEPTDLEYASVDTRVAPQGKLVIWLMANNPGLFERVNQYGIHSIAVSYPRQWFGKLCQPRPADAFARGRVRLEAATGLDFSDELDLAKPDGASERARQLLIWLAENHRQGNWDQFLSGDRQRLRWDKVIIAGSSHGSTTAARFAKYQRVDRVVMFCGPRDQDQDWQGIVSATPANCYFGFSHLLDGGWTADHYCRSWELLGMQQFGPIVNVDQTEPPYRNTRRLITAADVGGDPRRAHSSVQPGRSAPKDENGKDLFEPVWRYLFNHSVDLVGSPTHDDPDCTREHE